MIKNPEAMAGCFPCACACSLDFSDDAKRLAKEVNISERG